ncbi:hypothetical protein WDU94_005029 [Cyamophila willieti]
MTDYFEEFNITPLAQGETPNHMLHLARLLRDFGMSPYEFNDELPPPASKAFVDNLEEITSHEPESSCPICLKQFSAGEIAKKLDCKHIFHSTCILPWLEKTSTCPLCRHEFKTDNADYEAYKTHKKREKEREGEIENLHNSMFS